MQDSIELSVVMPCLNEAESLPFCIGQARAAIAQSGLRGEILVADNGSSDNSIAIAEGLGARVVRLRERGYGNTLRGGIEAARGEWIVIGDADGSYDFSEAQRFLTKLRDGCDLVIGCRLPVGGGNILPGAMPWQNRWIGNPMLSLAGRLFFKSSIHDFHCGLRALTKSAFARLNLKTSGMEFASEMIGKAALARMAIAEVPVTLHKDRRARMSHLRPWRDGWRHLRFMLIYSPRWLFLVPGMLLSAAGATLATILLFGDVRLGSVTLSVGTLTIACMAVTVGVQLVMFAFFTKVFAIGEGLLPRDERFAKLFRMFTLEKGIAFGLLVFLCGVALFVRALWFWRNSGYGDLPCGDNLRRLIPALTLMMVAVQSIFASFFMSVLGLKTISRTPPSLT